MAAPAVYAAGLIEFPPRPGTLTLAITPTTVTRFGPDDRRHGWRAPAVAVVLREGQANRARGARWPFAHAHLSGEELRLRLLDAVKELTVEK